MADGYQRAPILVTEWGKMYVRKGLFYAPFYSWDDEHRIVMAPAQTLLAIKSALQTLNVENVVELGSKRRH